MNIVEKALNNAPIFYICRDIERSMTLESISDSVYIISNYTPFAKSWSEKYNNIFLLKEKNLLDTWQLMQNDKVINFIADKEKKPNIIVFKNTKQIEKICTENNWHLLNPSAELAQNIEQKISQIEWAEKNDLLDLFPKYEVLELSSVKWDNTPFVVQFNHSHTGSGTILIDNAQQLQELKNKFPKRSCRTAPFISGALFNNNNVVWGNNILQGNINYQITGLKPFTKNLFATVGNDWALPNTLLTKEQVKEYSRIVEKVGKKMIESNWRGLFGIDVVIDEKTGKLYLLEINARQPASTSFESKLQANSKNEKEVTTFMAHLAGLIEAPYSNEQLTELNNGSQIIYRVSAKIIDTKKVTTILQDNNLNVIQYTNTKPNSDLLRIQSKNGIMKQHNVFNEVGTKIRNILQN